MPNSSLNFSPPETDKAVDTKITGIDLVDKMQKTLLPESKTGMEVGCWIGEGPKDSGVPRKNGVKSMKLPGFHIVGVITGKELIIIPHSEC